MNASILKYQVLMLVLGFGLWAVLGYFGKVPLEPLIALMQMGLGGLITLMLKGDGVPAAFVAPAPAPAVAIPGQTGRMLWAYPLLLLAVVALGLSMLTGCAGLNAQGVLTITYNTPATLTSATLSPGGAAALLAAPAALPAAPASAAK